MANKTYDQFTALSGAISANDLLPIAEHVSGSTYRTRAATATQLQTWAQSGLSDTYAPLASPALTGNPTAPTQTLGNDSTRIATTAFVTAAIGAIPATAWGSLTGTLSDQTDLQSALDLKANSASLAAIATSGSADDLSAGTVPLARISGLTDAEISVSAAIDAAKIADGSVSNAEFQRLNGVTSDIQTQIDGKAATSHTHAAADIASGTIALARLSGITTAELSATAGITNGQLAGSIAYSKLSLTGAILNADLAGSIAISKLAITGTPTGSKYLRDDGSWQAIPGGGDALTSNPLSQFASTTSLQLAGVISDETGSGALVFASSPTLVTPNLGTPSAATLTNATGLPVATGISGLGTGIATFLATPSSANLATAVTDETGSGALVFGTGPTLTSPRAVTAILDTNGNELFGLTATGSAVNEFTVANAATGNAPVLSVTGGDTNISMRLTPKGTGGVVLSDGSAAAPGLRFASDASSLGWYRSAQGWTFSYTGTTTLALASEGIRLSNAAKLSFAGGDPASNVGDVAVVRLATGGLRISDNSTGAGNLSLGTSAGAFGTSAAGVLAFTLSTAPSTAPTDTAQLYSNDVSAGDHRLYLRNEGVAGSPVVTQISTDTLTNKTISGASNTLSSIGNSSLTNSSVTIGSTSVSLGATATTVAGLTLTTPTIASFTNATHDHTNAAGGGQIAISTAISGLGTGVATALGVNVGSAGAFVAFNGALGTPSSGTLTNATGLPVGSGISGFGTGVATALAVNVGSAGAFVTFNGALGTPSSGTLTNATGLPPTTGISGWPANASGVLTNNGSGTLTWGAAGGGLTVGTTTVTSGTGGRLMYETTGNVLGEISTLTSDGTIVTFSPTVTTGTGATSGLNANANSLTTGDGFNFGSSSVTSGNVMKIAATGTAAASNTKTALNVATSGANGTSTQTSYAAQFSNTSTGTSSTNIGALFVASGGSTNIPIAIVNSNLGLSGFSGGTNGLMIRVGGSDVAGQILTNYRLTNSGQFDWASGSGITSGVDTGLGRPQAATVRVQGSSSTVAGTFSSAANTPTQLAANTNNWAIGTGLFNRVSSDASRDVTGIVAGVDGQIAFDWNVGSNDLVYKHENASSTAANRFTSATAADITLSAGQCLFRQYSATTSRWLVVKF